MHVLKIGKDSFGKVKGEAFREEGFHSKVGTIDPEKTKDNITLVDRVHSPGFEIDEHIKASGVSSKIRADAVRAVSVIVDLPKDEKDVNIEKYFRDAQKGVLDALKLSENDVLYSVVHMDEGHPHMHLSVMPLVEKEKRYKDGHTKKQTRLSAKDILTPESLQELHPFVQQYMMERGYEGTLHYADEVKRDKAFMEHKIDKLQEELDNLENNIGLNSGILAQEQARAVQLRDEVKQATAQLDDIRFAVKDYAEMEQSKKKKVRELTEELKNTSVTLQNAQEDIFRLQGEISTLEENEGKLKGNIKALEEQKAQIDVEMAKLKTEKLQELEHSMAALREHVLTTDRETVVMQNARGEKLASIRSAKSFEQEAKLEAIDKTLEVSHEEVLHRVFGIYKASEFEKDKLQYLESRERVLPLLDREDAIELQRVELPEPNRIDYLHQKYAQGKSVVDFPVEAKKHRTIANFCENAKRFCEKLKKPRTIDEFLKSFNLTKNLSPLKVKQKHKNFER